MNGDPAGPASISVVHAEGDLVVIDKPSGLAVHRNAHSRRGERFVVQCLAEQLGRPVWPVHRLDRATSGLMMLVTDPGAVEPMVSALRSRGASKRYLVLARGSPPDWFESRRALTGENGRRQAARTSFRVLERFQRASLLEATLGSGRRRQIRRHLAHLAWHVAGDTSHGKGWFNRELRDRHDLQRLFLHAASLVWPSTRNGALQRLEAPLPRDLSDVLVGLRAEGDPIDGGT